MSRLNAFAKRYAERPGALPSAEWLDAERVRAFRAEHPETFLACARCLAELKLVAGIPECPVHGRHYCMAGPQ